VKPGGDSAAKIFERINRRRAELAQSPAGHAPPGQPVTTGTADPRPVRAHVDEVLFQTSNARFPDSRWPQSASPAAGGSAEQLKAESDPAADRFPRSATMRLILKHPALALGLGVPAAGLLLKSPASRRLLGMAVRVGTGPELQTLMRLSTGAAQPEPPTRPDRDPPLP